MSKTFKEMFAYRYASVRNTKQNINTETERWESNTTRFIRNVQGEIDTFDCIVEVTTNIVGFSESFMEGHPWSLNPLDALTYYIDSAACPLPKNEVQMTVEFIDAFSRQKEVWIWWAKRGEFVTEDNLDLRLLNFVNSEEKV